MHAITFTIVLGKGFGRSVRSTRPISLTDSFDVREEFAVIGVWKKITLNTCERLSYYYSILEEGGCDENSDSWEYICHIKTKTCMYSVKCKIEFPEGGDDEKPEIVCQETHVFTGWTCCDVKCPD